MKFFHLLTFVAVASATPLLGHDEVALEKRTHVDLNTRQAGGNLAQLVLNTVNTAAGTIGASLNTIQSTVNGIGSAVNVDVQAIIEANLVAIAQALQTGTDALTAAIAAAGGNIAGAVAGFGLQQIRQLVTAVNNLVALLTNLGVSLQVIVNGLQGVAPAVLDGIRDELAAVQALIQPFTAPVGDIVDAVRAVSVIASVALSGFDALVPGLLSVIGGVLGGL